MGRHNSGLDKARMIAGKDLSSLFERMSRVRVCVYKRKGWGGGKDLTVIAKLSGLEIDTGLLAMRFECDTRLFLFLSLSFYSSLLIEKHRSKGETIPAHFDTFLYSRARIRRGEN